MRASAEQVQWKERRYTEVTAKGKIDSLQESLIKLYKLPNQRNCRAQAKNGT